MHKLLSMVALVAGAAAPGPAVAQRAGQLISAAPVVDTPAGMQAWRIVY